MHGTWRTEGGGHGAELVGALVVIVAAVAAAEWILSVIWVLLAIVAVIAAGAVYAGRRMYLKYGRAPEVLPWQQRAALPARQARPVTARALQALPAPPVVHYHLHVGQDAIAERRPER